MKSSFLKKALSVGLLLLAASFMNSCKKAEELATASTGNYLYFASGACYPGNSTSSRPAVANFGGTVGRILLSSGQNQGLPVADYNQIQDFGFQGWPVGIVEYDANNLLAVVEFTGSSARIVDKISKTGLNSRSQYTNGAFTMTSVVRNMSKGYDGSIFVAKSTGVEKFNVNGVRLPNTTTQFINISTNAALSGSCANTSTNITSVIELPNKMVFMTHSTGGQNRLVVGDAAGFNQNILSECKSALAITTPSATAFASSAVLIPGTNPYQILVSFSNTGTVGNEGIYQYLVDATTGAITAGTMTPYTDQTYLRGISAMTYDSTNKELYVANGSTAFSNTIEKFSYNPTSPTLTRMATFYKPSYDTICINSMFISN